MRRLSHVAQARYAARVGSGISARAKPHSSSVSRGLYGRAFPPESSKLSSADIAHIAEEIESIGKREKREWVNQLTVLLLHLLKWRFQPGLRGNAGRYTIKVQRRDLARHLDDNPSLRAQLAPVLADAYASAVLMAAGETGLPEANFPAECPWSYPLCQRSCRPDRIMAPGGAERRTWHDTDRSSKTGR
jgi:hypothetical protein